MRSDGAVARPSGRVRRAQAKRRAAGWGGFVSSGPGAAGAQELEHARALCPPEMLIIPLSHLQVVPWSTMAPFQSTMSVPCRYPVVPDVAYHRALPSRDARHPAPAQCAARADRYLSRLSRLSRQAADKAQRSPSQAALSVADWLQEVGHTCAGTKWARPCPHLHRHRAAALPTSARGLGLPPQHRYWGWAHPRHICAGTGLTPAAPAFAHGAGRARRAQRRGRRCRCALAGGGVRAASPVHHHSVLTSMARSPSALGLAAAGGGDGRCGGAERRQGIGLGRGLQVRRAAGAAARSPNSAKGLGSPLPHPGPGAPPCHIRAKY